MLDGARESIPRWPLTVLRIYAGLILVSAAVDSSAAWNAAASVEVLAGVALFIGAATPAAALLALFVVTLRVLPLTSAAILISPGPRTAFAVLLVTVALGRAGRVLGIDARLAKRYPRVPLW